MSSIRSADISALFAAPKLNQRIGIRDQAIIALIAGSGLTPREVLNTLWIQYSNHSVLIVTGKSGRQRTVAVPPWAQSALDRWFRFNPSDRIVPTSRMHVWRIIRRYMDAARIGTERNPSELRKLYIEARYHQRTPIQDIAAALGHKQVSYTLRILSKSDSTVKAARQRYT